MSYFQRSLLVEMITIESSERRRGRVKPTKDFQGTSLRTHSLLIHSSPFQLQITGSVRERRLQAMWTTIAAPTLPSAVVRQPTLLLVTERGFTWLQSKSKVRHTESMAKKQPQNRVASNVMGLKISFFFSLRTFLAFMPS